MHAFGEIKEKTNQNLLLRLQTYLLSKNIPRTKPNITPPINNPSFLLLVDFLVILFT